MLGQFLPDEQLAVSVLAGRREYWQALVGSAAFVSTRRIDPTRWVEGLAAAGLDRGDRGVARYFAQAFQADAPDVLAAAVSSMRLLGPRTYVLAMQLVTDYGVCKVVCADSPDPDCMRKCLKHRPLHEGFEDDAAP